MGKRGRRGEGEDEKTRDRRRQRERESRAEHRARSRGASKERTCRALLHRRTDHALPNFPSEKSIEALSMPRSITRSQNLW